MINFQGERWDCDPGDDDNCGDGSVKVWVSRSWDAHSSEPVNVFYRFLGYDRIDNRVDCATLPKSAETRCTGRLDSQTCFGATYVTAGSTKRSCACRHLSSRDTHHAVFYGSCRP